MCNLCGTPEEKERGRKQCKSLAEDLSRMAEYQLKLANGSMKPHTQDMKQVTSLAHFLIRELVNEYV